MLLARRQVPRSAHGGHREKQDGLLTRSSFAPTLVLASPLQRHVHVGVLPGAVGVVVVALQPLQEVALVCRSFLEEQERQRGQRSIFWMDSVGTQANKHLLNGCSDCKSKHGTCNNIFLVLFCLLF